MKEIEEFVWEYTYNGSRYVTPSGSWADYRGTDVKCVHYTKEIVND